MEKKQQMLIIEPPSELKFTGPFNKPSITTLKLTNPTDNLQLFKIKTTAPRKYCVRPNFGAVKPNSNTVIDICLQPFTLEQNEKNKHKFMVQSYNVPEGTPVTDHEKMWKEIDPDQLADTKLKCVFEFPSGSNESAAGDKNDSSEGREVKITESPQKEESKGSDKSEKQDDLRKENSTLIQENIKLQEQILRLKLEEANQAFTPPTAVQEVPMIYILLSIIAAIVGVILGKFLL